MFAFATSSSSFAQLSSLTLRVFPLSLPVVGLVKRVGVIVELLLVIGQVIELEVWVLLEAAIGVKFHHAGKGKGAIKLFVCAPCMYRVVGFLRDRVEKPIHFFFVSGGFGGGIVGHHSTDAFELYCFH